MTPKSPKPPKPYAEGTRVDVLRTREQIRNLLARHGATDFDWIDSERLAGAGVEFSLPELQVRLRVQIPMPREADFPIPKARTRKADMPYERERRRRWRAFYAYLHARLMAIQEGLREMAEEFRDEVVMADNRTWREHQEPAFQRALASGETKALPEKTEGGSK